MSIRWRPGIARYSLYQLLPIIEAGPRESSVCSFHYQYLFGNEARPRSPTDPIEDDKCMSMSSTDRLVLLCDTDCDDRQAHTALVNTNAFDIRLSSK